MLRLRPGDGAAAAAAHGACIALALVRPALALSRASSVRGARVVASHSSGPLSEPRSLTRRRVAFAEPVVAPWGSAVRLMRFCNVRSVVIP
jgi:hypothetical protein